MSLIQFLQIIWARKNIILGAMALCFTAAMLASLVLPKRYEATSRVMMDVVKPDPVTGQVLSSQYVRAYSKTQTELVKDYRVAGSAVDKLGWTSSPRLAEQYSSRSSANTRDFRRWLAQIVIDNTNVSLIPGSNILEISFSSNSPETARLGADAVLEAYIDQMVAFRREDAKEDREWYVGQLEKLRGELTEAQKRKADFERANGLVLTYDNTDSDEERLRALTASPEPILAGVPAALQVSNHNSELAQIDAQIATASRSLGPNHPTLIGLRQQRDAIASAVAATRNTPRTSLATGPSISSQISSQTQKVLAQRGLVNEAQQLAAAVSSLRDTYQKALDKIAELDQLAQSSEASLTPLGKAVAPEAPAFPNVPLLIVGGLALGGLLGLLASILVELFNRRVRSAADIESLGIPLIGIMAPAEKTRTGLVDRVRKLARSWKQPRNADGGQWEIIS